MHEKQPDATQRDLAVPPLLLLTIASASFVAYNTASAALAGVVIYIYAFSLVVGPACVWLWLRHRGASTLQALAGCSLVPVAWVVKECVAVSYFFTASEALYYAFNPLIVGLFAAVGLQAAVFEIVWRRIRMGRWQVRGGPAFVIAGVLLLGATYAVVARAYGMTAAYYAYISCYRAIFGN